MKSISQIIEEQVHRWQIQQKEKPEEKTKAPIVTVSREPGSGGRIVAQKLSEKLGFEVLLEGEGLPDELKKDICLALTTDITARGALRTKAIVRLMNCSGELVYQSGDGISKEKEFSRVYQLAIQKAFDIDICF